MDLLNGNLKKTYLKYLFASIGSALVISIYSLVDIICVGQYYGEIGGAALGVILPIWTILFSFGILIGIGGSTIYATFKGQNDEKKANEIFSASSLIMIIVVMIIWILVATFASNLLTFFGGKDKTIHDLGMKYVFWMRIFAPIFTLNNFLVAFIRNDSDPFTASFAVIAGGIVNMILDVSFVFGLDMGASGAGLATCIGQCVSFLILITHFMRKNNTLCFVKIKNFGIKVLRILKTGFSSFILDIAIGGLTILFNNQIVRYYDAAMETSVLAVYGVIANVVALMYSFAYGVGQASQPLLSQNFGGNRIDRVKQCLRYGIITAFILGIFFTILLELFPIQVLKIFINVKKGELILEIAPRILRIYFISFLLLPFNILSTYYFQSILKPFRAFIITLLRGIIISGLLLILIPFLTKKENMWYTMPMVELIVLIISTTLIIKSIKDLTRMEQYKC